MTAYPSDDVLGTPAFAAVRTLVEKRRSRALAPSAESFAEFEGQLHRPVAGCERDILAAELARYDVEAPYIRVDGVRYRKALRAEETYVGQAGAMRVERNLYQPVGGGRTICPGAETPDAKALFESWKTILREDPDGAAKFIRVVRYRRDEAEGAARKTLTCVLKYLRTMKSGMEYHAYKALGLPIGSGVVEAACKTLVGERLKQSGMRWTIRGGQAILTLRGLLQSNRWDNAWAILARSYKATVHIDPADCRRPAA